jgi:hypothetical protein
MVNHSQLPLSVRAESDLNGIFANFIHTPASLNGSGISEAQLLTYCHD